MVALDVELFAQLVVHRFDDLARPVDRRADDRRQLHPLVAARYAQQPDVAQPAQRRLHRRNVRGRIYCGYCAAKDEKFFGWRLHLICTPQGEPVRFRVLPGSLHDLTPLHELTVSLPPGSRLFGDKGYNSAATRPASWTRPRCA